MTANWYALRTKPHMEDVVSKQTGARGFETFYPRLRVNPVNPRARRSRPYFPGYLFVSADLVAVGLSTFEYMPYAIGLVSFGGEPASVSDELIHALRRRLDAIRRAEDELQFEFKRGDPVWITQGPLSGYRALFDAKLAGAERVRVLLQMLSDRYVAVELATDWIEKETNKLPALSHQH